MDVVHACKQPCYMKAMQRRGKLIAANYPHYYAFNETRYTDEALTQYDLYLNMIDPDRPLFAEQMFMRFFGFVKKRNKRHPLLIHCNEGLSRAPSLALLVCAKLDHSITNTSYDSAVSAFGDVYAGGYRPHPGIKEYLHDNWAALDAVVESARR